MATIFGKILSGEIPATRIHEDDRCIAILDIDPKAPHHILILPRKPIPRLGEAKEEDAALLGHMLLVAGKIARDKGLDESGFRLVINHGPDGGETVPHLHMHLLGGRALEWPPG
ncbi:MAG: histidine triad nucleotide-binding protein [Verrucomicrobium sp.]|nr:histidine triad nucleotide-binding protein [Verrucomicrobium sp.]